MSYSNRKWNIITVAEVTSLPIDFKLYVKEAPANVTRDWRSKSEYNDILKIPNVTLIHPNYDSKNLLENCSKVI